MILFERIKQGEWPLGAKLPGENALAPQLGVGRSTAREAIRKLAGQGILTTRQGAGVFVTSLKVSEDLQTVVGRADIVEVIEGRLAIETEASSLAALRCTPADIDAIKHALRARLEAGNVEDFVDADTAFHRTIVVASGNKMLVEIFDSLVPRVRDAMISMLRIRGIYGDEADHCEHAVLVESVEGRDPAVAAAACRAHLTALKREIEGG